MGLKHHFFTWFRVCFPPPRQNGLQISSLVICSIACVRAMNGHICSWAGAKFFLPVHTLTSGYLVRTCLFAQTYIVLWAPSAEVTAVNNYG